jgi:hypothetical protein
MKEHMKIYLKQFVKQVRSSNEAELNLLSRQIFGYVVEHPKEALINHVKEECGYLRMHISEVGI